MIAVRSTGRLDRREILNTVFSRLNAPGVYLKIGSFDPTFNRENMVVVFFQQPLASVKRNGLLVFTVGLSKIKIESVQLIKSTIWEMKTFSICEIFEKCFTQIYKALYGVAMLVSL